MSKNIINLTNYEMYHLDIVVEAFATRVIIYNMCLL